MACGALALIAASVLFQDAFTQGVKLFEAGRVEEARARFAEALKTSPEDGKIWKAYGVTFAVRNELMDAEEAFAKACRLAPNLPDACYYWGRALYALNRFDQSIEPLTSALRTDADKGRARLALAQSLEGLGRAAEAEREFKAAVDAKSASLGEAHLGYGRFLFRSGRLDDALRQLRLATGMLPRSALAHTELGRIHYLQGRPKEAAPLLEKALSLNPSDSAAALVLAKIYRAQGRHEEAARLEAQGARNAQ